MVRVGRQTEYLTTKLCGHTEIYGFLFSTICITVLPREFPISVARILDDFDSLPFFRMLLKRK